MIDEKRLDLFAKDVQDGCDIEGTPEDLRELIRLARLGLWAEKHGIPTLQEIRTDRPSYDLGPSRLRIAREALAALPQEMKEKK